MKMISKGWKVGVGMPNPGGSHFLIFRYVCWDSWAKVCTGDRALKYVMKKRFISVRVTKLTFLVISLGNLPLASITETHPVETNFNMSGDGSGYWWGSVKGGGSTPGQGPGSG
jgi:hypothetical protein